MKRIVFCLTSSLMMISGLAFAGDDSIKAYISSPEVTAIYTKIDGTNVYYNYATSKKVCSPNKITSGD